MLKGLKIKNKHSKTLHNTSQTTEVDCADDTKNNDSDSSEDESGNEDLELDSNTLNNFNNNFSKNQTVINNSNEDLNSCPTLDAHAEPEEVIYASEDYVNNESINEAINMLGQDFNLSNHRRPICIYRPA